MLDRKKLLGAALALLLVSHCCLTAGANMTALPVVAPVQAPATLENTYFTMDTLLRQSDDTSAEQDYAEALLTQYSGVMVQGKDLIHIWEQPGSNHSLRTLSSGKVAQLLGIKSGWYRVCYGHTVGYVRPQYAVPVVYAAYEGTSAVSNIREDVTAAAMDWLGVRYRFGGSSRSGTDCSGFTMAIFSQFGYSLAHGAGDQYAQCRKVTDQEREAGDLVFFSWGSGIDHVGIYLGGGTFIHASTSGGVIISSLYESYYANGYVGAGRILTD